MEIHSFGQQVFDDEGGETGHQAVPAARYPPAKATAYVAEGGAKKARARARTRFRQASGQLTTA